MDRVDRIFELLKKRGISQKDFAEGIGVRPATVSEWKRRNNCPTTAKYIQIAEYLNVSLDYLLTGKEYLTEEKNFNQNGNQIISGQSSTINDSFKQNIGTTQQEQSLLSYFSAFSDDMKKDVLSYCFYIHQFGKDALGQKRCSQYTSIFKHLICTYTSFWELSLLLDVATDNEIKFLSDVIKTEFDKRQFDYSYYISKDRLELIKLKQ